MQHKLKLLGLALLGFAATSAKAVLVTASFTATGFAPLGGGVAPPADPVSGSFTYNAASLGATIDSLVSISLTIDGHVYTLADTAFASPFSGNLDIVYGSLNGLAVSSGSNDFWIRFDRVAGTGLDMVYSSASVPSTNYQSFQFSNFSLSTGQTVPEPGSAALAALALGAAVWAGRRKAA